MSQGGGGNRATRDRRASPLRVDAGVQYILCRTLPRGQLCEVNPGGLEGHERPKGEGGRHQRGRKWRPRPDAESGKRCLLSWDLEDPALSL